MPWWLPQALQDGMPDDLEAELAPPQRVLRASRASGSPRSRWLSQAEQDGLPDDRPAVTEAARSSEVPGRLKTAVLSLLRRAIFSIPHRPHGQDNQLDDNQCAVRAASAEADASGAR